jgi:hypothetical protein
MAPRFALGLLTHNVLSTGRRRLLRMAVDSLLAAFPDAPLLVLDNGSDDGSAGYVADAYGERVRVRVRLQRNEDGNNTPGRGNNVLIDWMLSQAPEAEIHVKSDDDVLWHERAGELLARIWSAPFGEGGWRKEIALVGGYLEPEWSWNTPRETVFPGGVPVLIRDSTGSGAWTYRADDRGGLAERFRQWRLGARREPPLHEGFGADHAFCLEARASGALLAQADLAEHLGASLSTRGSDVMGGARPLDRKRWRI